MHGLEIIIANTIQYIKHTKYHAKHFISLFLLSQLPFHCSQSLTTYLDIRFLKKKKKFYDTLFQTYAEVERRAHKLRFSFNNIDQSFFITPCVISSPVLF